MADGERKHYPPNAWHKPSMEDLAPASPAPSPADDAATTVPVDEAAVQFTQEVVAALCAFSDDDTADGMMAALDRIVEAARAALVPLAALLRSASEEPQEAVDLYPLRSRLLTFLATVGASTPEDHTWVVEARALANAVNRLRAPVAPAPADTQAVTDGVAGGEASDG